MPWSVRMRQKGTLDLPPWAEGFSIGSSIRVFDSVAGPVKKTWLSPMSTSTVSHGESCGVTVESQIMHSRRVWSARKEKFRKRAPSVHGLDSRRRKQADSKFLFIRSAVHPDPQLEKKHSLWVDLRDGPTKSLGQNVFMYVSRFSSLFTDNLRDLAESCHTEQYRA